MHTQFASQNLKHEHNSILYKSIISFKPKIKNLWPHGKSTLSYIRHRKCLKTQLYLLNKSSFFLLLLLFIEIFNANFNNSWMLNISFY